MEAIDVDIGQTYKSPFGLVKIVSIVDPGFMALDKNNKLVKVQPEGLKPLAPKRIKRIRISS